VLALGLRIVIGLTYCRCACLFETFDEGEGRLKPTAMMKFGGISAAYVVAQMLLGASTQAQPSGIPGPSYVEPLGIALEGWPYPYQVRFMPLDMRGQKLRMAFMDVPPSGTANGRTVVLLHGKNFDSSYWRGTIGSLTAAGFVRSSCGKHGSAP
jgi:pimeloyl-ACP methyl ester carboxylesterase